LFRRTRYQHGSVEREERKKGPAVWVYRWWEEDINGKLASQSPGRRCQEIPDPICGTLSSRRSSANYQQSLRTQESAANHNQHTLGALLSRGAASQSIIHTGCVHNLRKELDCPTLGQSTTRTSQNCRGRALATGDRSGRWDQSQNQVRDVGFVFARRPVGVLWPQSHLFRDTGGNWGQARPEHRRPDQRQTSEIPLGFVTGAGQARVGRIGVSGSVACVSRRGLRYTSRGARGATLAIVRFRQHEHQRPTLVLLASRWKSEEYKNGGVSKATADASKPEALLAGVEVAKPLQQTGRFRVSFRKTARQQAVRSSFSVKEEDSACIQTNRYHGCGLAHVSALGRKHAGGDGRTSAHNPRLLAAQQPTCDEQIPAGNIEDQTFGTGQIGRRYFADGYFAEDKPNPMSVFGTVFGWDHSRSALIVP
jgi:hypothetical protein